MLTIILRGKGIHTDTKRAWVRSFTCQRFPAGMLFIYSFSQGAKHEPGTLPHPKTEKLLRACRPSPSTHNCVSSSTPYSTGRGIHLRAEAQAVSECDLKRRPKDSPGQPACRSKSRSLRASDTPKVWIQIQTLVMPTGNRCSQFPVA